MNAYDVDGDTILHQLCYWASTIPNVVDMVELVLRLGADGNSYELQRYSSRPSPAKKPCGFGERGARVPAAGERAG